MNNAVNSAEPGRSASRLNLAKHFAIVVEGFEEPICEVHPDMSFSRKSNLRAAIDLDPICSRHPSRRS
jgi:hypothetical protein